jgi:apolipoprotein D and lipocalin family protein
MGARQSNYDKNSKLQPIVVENYTGKWYQVARLENRFQNKDAKNVTAVYSTNENGTLNVINTEYVNNERISITGLAHVVNDDNNRFKVRFPFVEQEGDYIIRYVGKVVNNEYSCAVVSDENFSTFWVLSRTKVLPSLDCLLCYYSNVIDLSKVSLTVQE